MIFSGLDYLIIAFVLASGGIGIWRGFFKELFGLLSWTVAILAMILGVPLLAKLMGKWIKTELIAEVVSAMIISMLMILLVAYTFKRFNEYIKKSKIRRSDRMFGFVIGIMRAFIVMMIFYTLLQIGSPKELQRWENKSALITPISKAVHFVEGKLPKEVMHELMPEPEMEKEKKPLKQPLKQERVKKPVVKENEETTPPADEIAMEPDSDKTLALTEEAIIDGQVTAETEETRVANEEMSEEAPMQALPGMIEEDGMENHENSH